MRALFGEYGSFLVEVIAGASVLGVAFGMWPLIRDLMDRIVFMLI